MTAAAGDTRNPGYPHRGNALSRALGRALLRLAGWRIEGQLPALPKFEVIVAPHTSAWDVVIGVCGLLATGLQASWFGKHTLFRFPLSALLRWLGGEPVDRSAPHGVVDAAVKRFQTRAQWVLGLAPEGTRRRVVAWKTGFLRIAAAANVPIVPIWFDYRSRVIGIGAPVRPSGDADADMARVRGLYHKDMARRPALFAE
jgi:1-acyl-sn-glycerol-3-phosphate acyltransferase